MITIKEVMSGQDRRAFLDLPKRLFRDHKNFVCPLDSDIENTFDPAKNHLFKNGEATRFLAQDTTGKTVGRVAVFIDHRTCGTFDCPTGGMGFFDSENDEKTAFLLFEACQNWLAERGMEAMNGPINFGENHRFWGLYRSGDGPPVYGHFYHPPYYLAFFENFGFHEYFNQAFMSADIRNFEFVERVLPSYEALMQDENFSCKHIGEVGEAKFTADFCKVFNAAWAIHTHFTPMKVARFAALLKKLRPVLDNDLFWVAYHGEKPIGIYLMLRDLNPFLQKANNGKMGFFQKIKLKIWLMTGGCRRIYAFVFGIVPEFQHRHVGHLMMITSARHIIPQRKYDTLEIAWVGDFNPKMMRLMSLLKTKKERLNTTFRFVFDRQKGVERAPVVG